MPQMPHNPLCAESGYAIQASEGEAGYGKKEKEIMPRKKKKDWNGMAKAMIVLVGLLLISGTLLHFSNEKRAEEGWFTSSDAITFNNFCYVIFFGLLTGTVVAVVVSALLKMMGVKSIR